MSEECKTCFGKGEITWRGLVSQQIQSGECPDCSGTGLETVDNHSNH